MCDDHHDLLLVLLPGDGVPGQEPLLEWGDGPADLIGAGPRLHQEDLAALYHQLPVEPPEAGNIRVDVVNQAHVKNGVWKRMNEMWNKANDRKSC